MQDATAGSQDAPIAGYSLQEAATLLGIGVNTLRRRIAAGQVRAEQVERPQGYVWRVYLDGRHPPSYPTDHPPSQEAPGSLPQPPTQLAQAEALASLIQATLTPIIGPLVAELAASRQANERQADRVAELEREAGRLTAELVGAHATISTLTASTAPQSAETATDTPTPLSRLLALWRWLVLVVAVTMMVVLLAWPR
jgi:hypothetical protein